MAQSIAKTRSDGRTGMMNRASAANMAMEESLMPARTGMPRDWPIWESVGAESQRATVEQKTARTIHSPRRMRPRALISPRIRAFPPGISLSRTGWQHR